MAYHDSQSAKGITDVIEMSNEDQAQLALGTMQLYVVELAQVPIASSHHHAWSRKRNAKVVASSASSACAKADKYFSISYMFYERLTSYPFNLIGAHDPRRETDDHCVAYRTDLASNPYYFK